MSESILDPEEMEAIQASIRESAPASRRGHGASATVEPSRMILISDDRIAEATRPVLINLASRAARTAARLLKNHIPGAWQLDMTGAEIVDGTAVKDELRGGWVAGLSVGDVELVLAAHGAVIDAAAARRCGSSKMVVDDKRVPSAVALRLFQPCGRALLDSWCLAWREVFSSELAASTDLGIVSRVLEARSVLRVTLSFSGELTGRIQVYARPEVLASRPPQLAAFKIDALRIAGALSSVPVEVVAELGTLRMKLSDLRKATPGAQFTLTGFVDSLVPIYCGGVLKAWARPIVTRGVLAVQIESVVHGQGTKS